MTSSGFERWSVPLARRLATAATAACVAATMACGGGGGGSGVSLRIVGPNSVVASLPEGTALPYFQLTVRVSGDTSGLEGRTLYVAIGDPAGLYQADPVLTFPRSDTVQVLFTGRRIGVEGHYTGHVTLAAYLDEERTEPFGNPIQFGYDVTVTPGLRVAQELLEVEHAFGSADVVERLAVSPPQGTTLELETSYDADPFRPRATIENNAAVRFVIPAAPVGTYAFTYTVTADAGVGGTYFHLTKDVTLRYTITPSDAPDVLVAPSEITYGRPVGEGSFVTFLARIITNTGVTYDRSLAVEILEYPAAAEGIGGWVRFLEVSLWETTVGGQQFLMGGAEVNPSPWDMIRYNVLPAGTYRARMGMVFRKGEVEQTVYLPVTFTLTP